MNGIDKKLYDFIMDNLSVITEEWLSHRKENTGSIYSTDADESIENLLTQQNRFTNQTIASVLLKDQSLYEEYKQKWALNMAESRVGTNTPIHEVLHAISKARATYCKFLERFILENKAAIEYEDILNWGQKIHLAFDELTIRFSENYYEMMSTKIKNQQNLIDELGISVILIKPLIGVLPLIGDIDTLRADTIIEKVPEKCTQANITSLFIDLSGALIPEPIVIQKIQELTNVLALLGIKSTITGIRPEFALASNQMGVSFSDINSFSSLQLALKVNINKVTV